MITRISDSRDINNIPTVYILQSEIDYIEEVVRSKPSNNRLETGGLLLGKKIKNGNIVILKATDPGPKAEHYPAEFAPDVEYSQKILNQHRNNYDVYWIGAWHKHPDHFNRLSSQDSRQMEQFIDDKDTLDEFIALIITMGIRGINTDMFYMDKSKKLYPIDFEIIDRKASILKELERITHKEEDIKYIHDTKELIKKPFTKKIPTFFSSLWYQTHEGKLRLRNEFNEMQKLSFIRNIETYEGDEFLTIKVNLINFPSIMFVCPPEYPLNPPIIVYSEEYKEFESCYVQGWNSLNMLSDILLKIVDNEMIFRDLKQARLQTMIRPSIVKKKPIWAIFWRRD